jgi:hypothetical protein
MVHVVSFSLKEHIFCACYPLRHFLDSMKKRTWKMDDLTHGGLLETLQGYLVSLCHFVLGFNLLYCRVFVR